MICFYLLCVGFVGGLLDIDKIKIKIIVIINIMMLNK